MSVVRPRLTHGWKQLRKDYYLRGTCTIWMHLIEDCVFNMYIFNSEGKELYVPGAPLRDIYKSDDDDDEFYSNLRQSLSSESSLLDHIECDGYISAQSSGVVATTDLTIRQQLDVEGGQEVPDVVAADNVVDGAEIEPEIIENDDGLVDGDVIIPVAPIPDPGIIFQCIFTCTLTTYYATKSHLYVPKDAAAYLIEAGLHSWMFVGPKRIPFECRILISSCHRYAKIGSGWRFFCEANQFSPDDYLLFQFTSPEEGIAYVNYGDQIDI
ncbi:uncharacterized protein LOC130715847 [Lotus japonicus]|nr:uncharacterized protein LOC130715847 [Lotus japonicus]